MTLDMNAYQHALEQIHIFPRRIWLRGVYPYATAPMVRGVWGAALREIDMNAYEEVFIGSGSPHERTPAYIVRQGIVGANGEVAVDWILIGKDASKHDAALTRAWDIASGMGLGPERQRFVVSTMTFLTSDQDDDAIGPVLWPISHAEWPLAGEPATTSCRLRFRTPIRLIRQKRLITTPSLPDIVAAVLRRIIAFAPQALWQSCRESQKCILDAARQVPAVPGQWQPLDLVRYSGSQERELEYHGVTGWLDLPLGPGPIWPLLAAAQWLHIGKGTTLGMGRPLVEPLVH